MVNSPVEMVQIAVQHQIHVKLGKETVTVTVNAQEILYVELIIVYLSLGIAHQTLIAVKRVKLLNMEPFDMNYMVHFLENYNFRLEENNNYSYSSSHIVFSYPRIHLWM